MKTHLTPSAPQFISLADIYYVLFRHKWKIFLGGCLGLLGAAALYLLKDEVYQSEAKLLIRYVREERELAQTAGGASLIKSVDQGADSIMTSELAILSSQDVFIQVATNIGLEEITEPIPGQTKLLSALLYMLDNLEIDSPRRSNVIRLAFKHPERRVAQETLAELIAIYLRKHREVHGENGSLDQRITQETLTLKDKLELTEKQLREAKSAIGVVEVDAAKQDVIQALSKVKMDIFATETSLAESVATANETARILGLNLVISPNGVVLVDETKPITNATVGAVAPQPSETANPAPVAEPAADAEGERMSPQAQYAVVAEYKRVLDSLDQLARQEQDLLLRFKEEYFEVKQVRKGIQKNRARKAELEKENPQLFARNEPDNSKSGATARTVNTRRQPSELDTMLMTSALNRREDLTTEMTRIKALQSKLQALTNHFNQVRMEADILTKAEGSIVQMERDRALDEENYRYFAAHKEQSRIDEALSPGRISNISILQSPTPPAPVKSRLEVQMAAIFISCVGFALALAFAIELLFDRSVRRASEVELRFSLPMALSIPRVGRKELTRFSQTPRLPALTEGANAPDGSPKNGEGEAVKYAVKAAPKTSKLSLTPYFEALRDRLIAYFEIENLTHKPKLMAVTSCADGAGVTTTAAGLAAALSETGDGNVLLVDMNQEHSATHRFYHGRLHCGLDDVLAAENRDNAQVGDNLFVVSAETNGDKLARALPRRFNALVPKLKESDYDYIIFDLPPVSQISLTTRIARFMDMTLFVMESEKTDRDMAAWATEWLAESTPNINVILNKHRRYVPRMLHQEL